MQALVEGVPCSRDRDDDLAGLMCSGFKPLSEARLNSKLLRVPIN